MERRYGSEHRFPGFENYSNIFIVFDILSAKYTFHIEARCPRYLRVVGTFQNSMNFIDAYKCPAGRKNINLIIRIIESVIV